MENPEYYRQFSKDDIGYEVLDKLFSSVDQDIRPMYDKLSKDVKRTFQDNILGPNNDLSIYEGKPYVYYYNNNNYIIFENDSNIPDNKYRIIKEEIGEDGVELKYSKKELIDNFRLLSSFREDIRSKEAAESEIERIYEVYEIVKEMNKYNPYFNLEKNEYLDLIEETQKKLEVCLEPFKHIHSM